MNDERITADALDFWLKKSRMTQAELAEKTGLAQNYISQIKTGTRGAPSIKAVQQIAEAFGLSLLEFLSCKDDLTPELVLVERIKARPKAGSGGLETDAEHTETYAFHKKFIERKRGRADTLKIFEVAGDSMEPTLSEGDLILANQLDKDVRTGRIYLLRIGEELMVKRLENRPGGVLLIRSDNREYEDISVTLSEIDKDGGEIEIFGRMVWSCREY